MRRFAGRIVKYIEERLICKLLTKRNIALVDPECGCLRSPDVPLSVPCPDHKHSRSTERAFQALDQLDTMYPIS